VYEWIGVVKGGEKKWKNGKKKVEKRKRLKRSGKKKNGN